MLSDDSLLNTANTAMLLLTPFSFLQVTINGGEEEKGGEDIAVCLLLIIIWSEYT